MPDDAKRLEEGDGLLLRPGENVTCLSIDCEGIIIQAMDTDGKEMPITRFMVEKKL